MKLICTQENLKKALSSAERAVGRQSALPILGNFLLETENGRLKLSATNLEIGVVVWMGAKIEEDGRVTVPAKLLSQFIGNLPTTEVVTLESVADGLSVSCGGYRVKMKGLPASEFPLMPEKKTDGGVEIPTLTLKSALSRLLPSVALQETRQELTGICFVFSENSLTLAATDSFRLSEERIELEKPVSSTFLEAVQSIGSVILPAGTLSELSRAIHEGEKTLLFTLEENQVFLDLEGIRIISRLITGKFPDYERIIPKEFSFRAFLNRNEFLRALRIAGIFASEEIAVELDAEANVVRVESASGGVGEQKVEIPASIAGEGALRAVFHPRYLSDGVGFVETEYLAFFANTPLTPIAIKMADGDTARDRFTYIAMPIQK